MSTDASAEALRAVTDRYPLEVQAGEARYHLRELRPGDEGALLAFAQALPEHDLMFLRRDITDPREVAAWVADAARPDFFTLVACAGAAADAAIVGYVVLDRSALRWSRHVAELRLLVAPAHRAQGLGRHLTAEAFRVAARVGVRKVVAQMTTDQRGAMTVFHNLGFENEAVLHGHVQDAAGRFLDLIVMRRWVDAEEFSVLVEQAGAG